MNATTLDIDSLDWSKGDGLLPGIVQDARTDAVLMLGFLNREALQATLARGRVVFWSRTRAQLWEKGETSGHSLRLVSVAADCDQDTLLLRVHPVGPACHRSTTTCFGDGEPPTGEGVGFLRHLEKIIDARIAAGADGSYTAKLYSQGIRRIAQKVGEEGVEVALAAQAGEGAELVSEAADLLFHLALLLRARDLSLETVAGELAARHRSRQVPAPAT